MSGLSDVAVFLEIDDQGVLTGIPQPVLDKLKAKVAQFAELTSQHLLDEVALGGYF